MSTPTSEPAKANPRVIALTGLKQTGKDTVCEIIKKLLNGHATRFAFADALKQELAAACGVTVDAINKDKRRFRLGLQFWGSEFRRTQDKDYWVKQVDAALDTCVEPVAIITDCRFENEAKMVLDRGGVIIRVTRPIATGLPLDTHESERPLPKEMISHTISNEGDLEFLGFRTLVVINTLKQANFFI